MDYVTRRFIGLSKQFIRLTKKLQTGLSSLHRELETFTKSINKQIERQNENQHAQNRLLEPPIRIDAETHETEAAQTENRSRHNRNLGIQILLTLGTWGAFGAAAYYAAVAREQLKEAIQARIETKVAILAANRSAQAAEDTLQESRDDFRRSNRPYMALNLGMSAPSGQTATPGNVGTWLNYSGKQVEWSIHFKNYGRSPAVNVRAVGDIGLGPEAWRQVKWRRIGDNYIGSLTPPEGDHWITARRDVSPPDYKVFHDTFGNIAIFGHVEYEGLDGSVYWTEYCFSHGNGGAIEVCPTHNLGN